ncbi:hypothetical protein [Paenibacillus alvei]|uniref:Uncharacterized protein n=1 Tax=Paenibacillus alvei TaxID=44250 RepID=A0AAP7DHG7_PAEAL|nr:hypothetical protein [Paenibacillus alvei]MCY9582220.1 hypothetical protein [Paenibacillus alvei]MCY9587022.1 hypothetical protein [Paenibacillus alvei]NEZ40960.1 hypothetical protein [Paenibacillus alvei]NOJ69775.1 hypothetical protein [Paenibacillus alvei]
MEFPILHVCFKTIYRWLYVGLLVQGSVQVLRHKRKRLKPTETRGKFNIGKTISQRTFACHDKLEDTHGICLGWKIAFESFMNELPHLT